MPTPTVWEVLAEKLTPPEPLGPAEWIETRLNGELWSKSREVCDAIEKHRKVAVHSCHESSKTWTIARIAAWWIDQHPPGSARVLTTAPSWPQIRGAMWVEINTAHRRGNLIGRITQTEWWIGHYQAGVGRKPADYDPESLQGFHAEYMLVVVDEASGVEGLWEALLSLAANEKSKIIAIGNPDDPTSTFAKICSPDSGWHVIHIDGLESPNFTGEPVSQKLRDVLISRIYEQEMREEYGIESPAYIAKVRGLFPEDASDGVVPTSWVRACQKPEIDLSTGDVELGVDVGASEEGDPTVIYERQGNKAARKWEIRSNDSEKIADYVQDCILLSGATRVKVDVIGVGFGVVGSLNRRKLEGKHGAQIIGVNVGQSATDRTRFPNLRSQIWWEVGRELSRLKAWDLSTVAESTVAQLVAPKYTEPGNGLTVVEKKEETKKRLKRSTDEADALLLAFYSPVSDGWTSGTMIADARA